MSKEIKIKDIKTEKNINSKKKYITLAIAVLVIAFAIIKANSGKDEATIQTQATSEATSISEEKTVARIDIYTKLVDAKKPQFEVYVDGSETPEKQADWMFKYNTQGSVVQKKGDNLNLTIKVLNDTEMYVFLKSPWKQGPDGELVDNWVKYTSLIIDGEEILSEAVEVWLNKPFRYAIKAKTGEEHKIHAEWTKSYEK